MSANRVNFGNEDDDILYNSLCRLTNSNAKHKTKAKMLISPVHYKEGNKELGFIINEVYSTDGKGSISEATGKLGSRQHISNRKIKSIGTSLKNCDISDVISIDIDSESTKLPMMCKLMIIVEGAAYERGTRVLVRDAAIQVGEVCFNKQFDEEDSGRQIPIKIDSAASNLTDSVKYRSSENINYEAANKHVNIQTNLVSARSKSGGSLSNLSSIPLSIYSDDLEFNYFNKNLRKNMFESHLNLLEYTSIPFYQYITRNVAMQDFCNPIQEDLYEYIYKSKGSHRSSLSNFGSTHEFVEVKIPIRRYPEVHRNEKMILINNDHKNGSNTSLHRSDSFKSLKSNMRRYIDEKLNRFEAEITFFNDPARQALNLKPEHYPLSYTYHFNTANTLSTSSSTTTIQSDHLKNGKSCTNLMFMQVVDGRIMD